MRWSARELDDRIEEVVVDAYGDDEQLGSFCCVMDELLASPAAASVIGQPVDLVSVDDGGPLLGLRARCRHGGRTWEVALVDVELKSPADPDLDRTVAAYRRWVRASR